MSLQSINTDKNSKEKPNTKETKNGRKDIIKQEALYK